MQLHTGGLQTVVPLLIRVVTFIQACCKQLSPCLSGVSRPAANVYRLTARWSPITRSIVFYPDLLAVGGFTRDMCACKVRQDFTGAHFHALGWTTPQSLFILRHLRREWSQKFSLTRIFLQSSYLWNFFTFYSLHKNQRHLCVDFVN